MQELTEFFLILSMIVREKQGKKQWGLIEAKYLLPITAL